MKETTATTTSSNIKGLVPANCLSGFISFNPQKVHIVKAMVFPVACMDVRDGPQRGLSAKKLMLSNCGTGQDS